MQNIKKILEDAVLLLKTCSDSPRLDAELLLAHVTGLSRTSLISDSNEAVSVEHKDLFDKLIARRINHEPVAYLTGNKEFFGMVLEVNKSVLVPRPETEELVELALKKLIAIDGRLNILELGTGSGCISIAVASELRRIGRKFQITAIDKSAESIEVAARNVNKFALNENINLITSDWFSELKGHENKFNVMLANPPYVETNANDMSPETKHEPQHALFAGDDGLDDIKIIFNNLQNYLSSKSVFICEMGHRQKPFIDKVFAEFLRNHNSINARIDYYKDLAGFDRGFVVEID